jgi:hypothetical protein
MGQLTEMSPARQQINGQLRVEGILSTQRRPFWYQSFRVRSGRFGMILKSQFR